MTVGLDTLVGVLEFAEPREVVIAVEQILIEHGSLSIETLAQLLAERGLDLGSDPMAVLEDELMDSEDEVLMPLMGDRWAHLPTLLAGRLLTHRVSAAEFEHDLLAVAPDLEPVLMLSETPPYDRLDDGSPCRVVLPRFPREEPDRPIPDHAINPAGSLVLTPGTLDRLQVAVDDLVGLRLDADGITVVRVEGDLPIETADGLRQRILDLLQATPGQPQTIENLVYTVLADDPAAFAIPTLPLAELLTAWELPVFGDLVGLPGFDFARWRAEKRVDHVRRKYDLSRPKALAVAAAVRLHESVAELLATVTNAQESGELADLPRQLAELVAAESAWVPRTVVGSGGTTVAAILPLLAEPAVAQAVLREADDSYLCTPVSLRLFAQTLEPMVDRSARPAVRWLRAKAHERLGETAEAEQCLRAVERLEPSWPPALVDLARYAGDRGNAAGGLALLRRAGPDSAPYLQDVLEEFAPTPTRTVPRNQPCWCGSGRKFKHCHLHHADELPLPRRAGWLYQKAVGYLLAEPWIHLAAELAKIRTRYAASAREVREQAGDALIGDAVLFEGGALAEFVEHRGVLLPADELLLAQQWLLTERSVYEVTGVVAGESLTLRDLRTGDVTEVAERTASRTLSTRQLVCTHLLSVGDGVQIFGGLDPVGLPERDALLELLDSEPEPYDVVEFLSRRFAPPTLVNTEGDPLVLGEAVLRSDDPKALSAALDEAYRREDGVAGENDTTAEWVEVRTIEGLDRLCVNLRIFGDELLISANSERRLDSALATVRELQPGIVVLSDERTPMRNIRDAAELAQHLPRPSASSAVSLEDQPEVEAALAQHMRDYEQRWLDLPIPALAGRTPREAADDPTRREDLLRLLASFPESDEAGTMSPSRIRSALGLMPT